MPPPLNLDDYSKAYEDFVGDGSDVVGLVAYSLYKHEKRRRVVKIKKDSGKRPSLTQLRDIEDICLGMKEHFITKANLEMNKFLDRMISVNKEEIFKTYFIEEYNSFGLLSQINTNTTPGKPKSIWADLKIEVLGNIAWAGLLILATLLGAYYSGSVRELKQKIITLLEEPPQELPKDTKEKTALYNKAAYRAKE